MTFPEHHINLTASRSNHSGLAILIIDDGDSFIANKIFRSSNYNALLTI